MTVESVLALYRKVLDFGNSLGKEFIQKLVRKKFWEFKDPKQKRFQELMQALRNRYDKEIELSDTISNGPIDEVFLTGLPDK